MKLTPASLYTHKMVYCVPGGENIHAYPVMCRGHRRELEPIDVSLSKPLPDIPGRRHVYHKPYPMRARDRLRIYGLRNGINRINTGDNVMTPRQRRRFNHKQGHLMALQERIEQSMR